MKKKAVIAAVAAGSLLMLTGCSTVSTEPDQKALHYSGGSFSSKTFKGCVDPSHREAHGPGEVYYAYPTRQISYDATGGKGAESKPLTVVSLDNAEMSVPVTLTVTLKTDCASLRAFHENLANKYHAWWGGADIVDSNDDKVPDGWVQLLNFAIGKPLDTTLDRVSQQYKWRSLWNDPKTKAAIEQAVEQELPARIREQSGGDFFTVNTVLLQKPEPTNDSLSQAVSDEQAAVAKANSARAKANADKAAAEAQIAVAKAEAAQKAAEIKVLGIDGYLKKEAIEKGINPYQPPMINPGSN